MESLTGKTALITGAAAGIGRALALQLAREGCHLHLVDVNPAGLDETAAELNRIASSVTCHVCDLTQPEMIDTVVARCTENHSVVDLLINNAGVAYYGPTHNMTPEQWDWLMRINLLAPIRITQQLLPHLLQRPDAHVVNMCSISGIVAGGRFAAYHTSKFGLIGFTEALRAEYGRSGLGVTAICPGPVLTDLYGSCASGREDGTVPVPPKWLSTTAERVADKTIRAIRRNKRQVLITPMAHGLYQAKRFLPGLLDIMNQFSRKKKRRRLQRLAAEQVRLAQLAEAEKKAATDSETVQSVSDTARRAA